MLIDGISAAFRVGALPITLELKGLQCPGGSNSTGCSVCEKACRSFPLPSVAAFAVAGYPRTTMKLVHKPRNLLVCFDRENLLNRVKERPGGIEYLSSAAWLYELLSQGDCFSYNSTDGSKTLLLLSYNQSTINAMKEAVANDQKLLHSNPKKLTSAVMDCFDYYCQGSSKKEYILSCDAKELLEELQIKLPTERFGTDLIRFRLAIEFLSHYEQQGPENRSRSIGDPHWFQRNHLIKILDSPKPHFAVEDISTIVRMLEPTSIQTRNLCWDFVRRLLGFIGVEVGLFIVQDISSEIVCNGRLSQIGALLFRKHSYMYTKYCCSLPSLPPRTDGN
jgi:hypothetical protein